jgi:hypothetical protein
MQQQDRYLYVLCDLRLQKNKSSYLPIGNETGGWREVVAIINNTVKDVFSRAKTYIEQVPFATLFASIDQIPYLDTFLDVLKSLISLPDDTTLEKAKTLLDSFFKSAKSFWSYFNFEEAAEQTRISLVDFLSRFASVFVSALKTFFESILVVVVAAIRQFASLAQKIGTLCGQALKSVAFEGKKRATHIALFGVISMMELSKMGGIVSEPIISYLRTQSLEMTKSMQALEADVWKPAQWLFDLPWIMALKKGTATITALVAYALTFISTLVKRIAFASLSYMPELVSNVIYYAMDIIQPIVSSAIHLLNDTKKNMVDVRIPLSEFSIHLDTATELIKDTGVSEENKKRLRDAVYAVNRFKDHLTETQAQHYFGMLKKPSEMVNKINKITTILENFHTGEVGENTDDILFMELGINMEEFAFQNSALQERLKAAIVIAVDQLTSTVATTTTKAAVLRRRRPAPPSEIQGGVFGYETVEDLNEDVKTTNREIISLEQKLEGILSSPEYIQARDNIGVEAERLFVIEKGRQSILEIRKELYTQLEMSRGIVDIRAELQEAKTRLESKIYDKRRRLGTMSQRVGMITLIGCIGVILAIAYKYYQDHLAEIEKQKGSLSDCVNKWSKNDPFIRKMLARWKKDPSYEQKDNLEPSRFIDNFRHFMSLEQMNVYRVDTTDKESMNQYELIGRDMVQSWLKDTEIAVTRREEIKSKEGSAKGLLGNAFIWVTEKMIGKSETTGTGELKDRTDVLANQLRQVSQKTNAITSGGEQIADSPYALSVTSEFSFMFTGERAFNIQRFFQGPSAYNSVTHYLDDMSNFMRLRTHTLNSQLENYSDSINAPQSWLSAKFSWLQNQVSQSATSMWETTGIGGFNADKFWDSPLAMTKNSLTSINPSLAVQLMAGVQTFFFAAAAAVTFVFLMIYLSATVIVALQAGEFRLAIAEMTRLFNEYGKLFGFLTAKLLTNVMVGLYSRVAWVGWLYIFIEFVVSLYFGWMAYGFWATWRATKNTVTTVAGVGVSVISAGGNLAMAAVGVEQKNAAVTNRASNVQYSTPLNFNPTLKKK